MTERERRMFLFILGCSVNATCCGACEMTNRNAAEIVAEIRSQLSIEELRQVGLAPAIRCEGCED